MNTQPESDGCCGCFAILVLLLAAIGFIHLVVRFLEVAAKSKTHSMNQPASMIIQRLGQEWVSPGTEYWESGDEGFQPVPYGGTISMRTNSGWIILANVEQIMDGPDAGKIRRVYVKPEELNTGERPAN